MCRQENDGNWLFAPEASLIGSSSAEGPTLYAFDRPHWLIGIKRLTSFMSKVHHAAGGRLLSNASTLIGQQPDRLIRAPGCNRFRALES